MRRKITTLWAVPLAFVLTADRAAAAPPDPARFISDKAELLVRVEKPRELVQSFTDLDLVRELYQFEPLAEFANSTQAKRFYQLVGYFETELGAPWPELVDRLAGGGAAVGVQYKLGGAEAVAAIQGSDPELTAKFFDLLAKLLEAELAREGSAEALKRGDYNGAEGLRLGDLWVGHIDGALIAASSEDAIKAAVDRHAEGGSAASLATADGPKRGRELLPENPLLWAYVDYGKFKSLPEAKEVFETPRNNTLATLAFAGWLDVAGRSDFGAVGLYRDDDGFRFTLRFPAGRDGLPEEVEMHVPPKGEPGTLPLLEPKGVVFSYSFYFDFDAMYKNRERLFTEENAKAFEEGVMQGSRFIPAASIPQLLERSGAIHRVVIARPIGEDYAKQPTTPTPSGAIVTSMRDPAFVRTIEPIIRGAGFIASTQLGLKMKTVEHDGVKIVSYRFKETSEVPDDTENLRFGTTPCFAHVKDQFILCSNVELCKELIDIIRAESESAGEAANMRMRFYAGGVKDLLNTAPDQLVTQLVLGQAIPVEEAEAQIKDFLVWLDRVGTLTLDTEHGEKHFEFNIKWDIKKKD